MTQDRRGGGRRSRMERGGTGIPQLPWQNVVNPYAPMQLLDEERMEKLHDTSMRILSELGIRVMSDRVMDLFEAAGAIVDRETMTIRVDESLVKEALKTVPSSFTLTSRNPEKQVKLGGNSLVFGLVAGPPNVHDRINGRRQGNLADYQNFIKLAHHFNAIHIIGNQVCAPMELPANARHLDTYNANLSLSDLSFHCSAIGRARAMDGISMMAIARGITLEDDINELIDAKVKKEANRYIQRWADEKISVENGRWGPFIRYGKKMLKIPKKADDTKYTPEEAATFSLDDVKKMIELEIPGAFAKKEKKPAAKKKAATKKAVKKKK